MHNKFEWIEDAIGRGDYGSDRQLGMFKIQHYAAEVTYDGSAMVAKSSAFDNKDLITLLETSKKAFIAVLFRADHKERSVETVQNYMRTRKDLLKRSDTSKELAKRSVGMAFKEQLKKLSKTIEATEVHCAPLPVSLKLIRHLYRTSVMKPTRALALLIQTQMSDASSQTIRSPPKITTRKR